MEASVEKRRKEKRSIRKITRLDRLSLRRAKRTARRRIARLTRRRPDLGAINPDYGYRREAVLGFFGCGATKLDSMIANAEFPRGLLYSDGGRGRFWTGRMLMD